MGVCDSWENVECELFSDGFYESHKTGRRKRSLSCETADLPAGTPIPDFQSNCTKYHICVHSEYESELTRLQLSCAPGKVMDAKQRKCVPGNRCPSRLDKPRKTKKVSQKKNKKDKNNKKGNKSSYKKQSIDTKTSTESSNVSSNISNKNSKDKYSKNPSSKSLITSKNRRWLLTGPGAPSHKSLLLNSRIKRSTIAGLQKLREFTRKNANSTLLTGVQSETTLKPGAEPKTQIIELKDILKKSSAKKSRVKRTSNPRYSRVRKPNYRAAILDADSESLEELLELRAALRRRKYESEYDDEEYDEAPRRRSNKKRPYYDEKPRRRQPVVPEYDEASAEYEDVQEYEPEQEPEQTFETKEDSYEPPLDQEIPDTPEHMKPIPIVGKDLSALLQLAKSQVDSEPESKSIQNPEIALNKLLATLLGPNVANVERTTSAPDSETTTTLPAPPESTTKLATTTKEEEITKVEEKSTTPMTTTTEKITTPMPSTTEKSTTLRPYVIRRIPTPVPTTTLTPPVIRRMPIIRLPNERSGKYSGVRKRGRINTITSTTEKVDVASSEAVSQALEISTPAPKPETRKRVRLHTFTTTTEKMVKVKLEDLHQTHEITTPIVEKVFLSTTPDFVSQDRDISSSDKIPTLRDSITKAIETTTEIIQTTSEESMNIVTNLTSANNEITTETIFKTTDIPVTETLFTEDIETDEIGTPEILTLEVSSTPATIDLALTSAETFSNDDTLPSITPNSQEPLQTTTAPKISTSSTENLKPSPPPFVLLVTTEKSPDFIADQEYQGSYEYYDYQESQEVSEEPIVRKGSQEMQETKNIKNLKKITPPAASTESILHGYEPDEEDKLHLPSFIPSSSAELSQELQPPAINASDDFSTQFSEEVSEESVHNHGQKTQFPAVNSADNFSKYSSGEDEEESILNHRTELKTSALITPGNHSPKDSKEVHEDTLQDRSDSVQEPIYLQDHSPEAKDVASPPREENLSDIKIAEVSLEEMEADVPHHVTPSEVTRKSFSCTGKGMFMFHKDPTDFRVFHFCSPGFSTGQVLDFRFLCLDGNAFDVRTQKCEKINQDQ